MGTGLTRRTFVELGAAGVVLAATGGLVTSHADAASNSSKGRRRRDDVGVETDIAELQRLMALGQLSSEELTESYLDRIKRLNPTLNAVIETNNDARKIARRLDAERRAGHVRGPLHGIPVMVKDNIATDDHMLNAPHHTCRSRPSPAST